MDMKKQIAVAACCLAVSVNPLLTGCSPSASAEQASTGIESEQERSQSQDAAAVSEQKKQDAPAASYKDGTYVGSGTGMGGPIDVTLTVADGHVTVDEIVESGETAGIGGKEAIEDGTFKAQIEDAQSADIDGITGATMTTGGVRRAVEAALAQAK